jgi:hypothetical protein
LVLAGGIGMGLGGCMAVTPQLRPTDYAALEQVEDRGQREELYAENQIYSHNEPQGMRYTKGTSTSAHKRSWQSLDAVLRSDQNSAAALPVRQQRLSRLFTALTVVAGIVTVAGTAASAREGLNLGDLNGTGGMMLGGGLATLGFAIAAGVFYGKTKKGYERAVDIYNDSLGMRLGILDPSGKYIPPRGTLVDEDGNVVLDPMADETAPAEAEGPQTEPQEPALPAGEEAAPDEAADEPEPLEPEAVDAEASSPSPSPVEVEGAVSLRPRH